MAWQTLLISNPCKISIKNSNILLRRIDQPDTTIAISEISVVVIENFQVVLTAVFIAHCAKHNITIIFSDEKYMPVGVYLPFHRHSRMAKHAQLQAQWSKPFKNQLWKKIVKAKITNQKQVLCGITQQKQPQLDKTISQVQSGDKSNREAYAAKIYWKKMFKNFSRNNTSDIRNSALDYGYSIVRSAIARSLSASGLIPVLGVHHCNELNAFNLADDLIEPFRPFVDFKVYHLNETNQTAELSYETRIELINIINTKVRLNNDGQEKTTLLQAIQQTCSSLLKASEKKDVNCLLLPYYHEPIR